MKTTGFESTLKNVAKIGSNIKKAHETAQNKTLRQILFLADNGVPVQRGHLKASKTVQKNLAGYNKVYARVRHIRNRAGTNEFLTKAIKYNYQKLIEFYKVEFDKIVSKI